MTDSQWEQETPRGIWWALLIVAYLVGAFLTFGHVYNQGCGYIERTAIEQSGLAKGARYVSTTFRSCAIPVASGIIWPAYWAGRAAIAVTR